MASLLYVCRERRAEYPAGPEHVFEHQTGLGALPPMVLPSPVQHRSCAHGHHWTRPSCRPSDVMQCVAVSCGDKWC